MNHAPHLPDVGVLALVPDDFDQLWQSRHQILTRLSRYFQVIWMDPGPAQRSRGQRRAETPGAHLPGFHVCERASWLPTAHRPSVAGLLQRIRLAEARRLLKRHGSTRTVLSVWRPSLTLALNGTARDLAMYHIDDEYTFSTADVPLDERERRVISRPISYRCTRRA